MLSLILRTLCAVVLVATISGCAAMGMRAGVSQDDVKKMSNVAVVSILDSKMNYLMNGTTVFQNQSTTFDAAKWELNKLVEQSLLSNLKANAQFKHVGLLKMKFNASDRHNEEDVKNMLKAAKDEGYDTLILLEPSRYDNAPMYGRGYGIFHTSKFALKDSTHVYMLAAIRAYDTSSGKDLGWQWTFDSIMGKPAFISYDPVPWKDKPSDLTPAELAQINKALRSHIEKEVAYAVDAIGFAGHKAP